MTKKLGLIFLLLLIASIGQAQAGQKPEVVFLEGLKLLKENRLKPAQDAFKKAIKLAPGNYPSYFNLSLACLLKKDFKNALAAIKQAKELNPFDMRLDWMLACAHLMQRDLKSAQEMLASVIAKIPQDEYANALLGIVDLDEGRFEDAAAKFALVKNLNPADVNITLLLSLAYALGSDFSKALEKSVGIKDSLKEEAELSFYALMLEKNGAAEEAQKIYGPKQPREEKIVFENLLAFCKEKYALQKINQLKPEEEFQNPEVSKRIAQRIRQEQESLSPSQTGKKVSKRPFNLKGTFDETFEVYKRKPAFTSPINGVNSTSNLKLEGATKNNIKFSGQWEWFYNRWDHTKLDWYKVNVSKANDFEIEIGKFSAKRFPTLVSHPTVVDGVSVWKKFGLPAFKPAQIQLPLEGKEQLNLGETYRVAYNDQRLFKVIEMTLTAGRTLKTINLDTRKEKTENTYDTTGRFEQWTQAYRLYAQITNWMDLGSSFAITQDRPHSATVSSTTYPLESKAIGLDGGFDFLDNKLNCDWELAFSDYDTNVRDPENKHKRDLAWIFKTKYAPTNQFNFSYEQKAIGNNFKVEGAYQTEDKLTHTINAQYKNAKPKAWSIDSITIKFQPEIYNFTGGGENKKKDRTFQPVMTIRLPEDAKLTFDYKYYREYDKCNCSNYRTRTLKSGLDWEIKKIKTTFKPSYTSERKDDRVPAATDETSKKWAFSIENTSFKKWTLKFSTENEAREYVGYTTKSYREHIYSFEPKYEIIPYRSDVTLKLSRDKKDPSDTNQTDFSSIGITYNFTSKSGDDKFTLQYEKKYNIYEPWSNTSAYRQNYVKVKFSHKF